MSDIDKTTCPEFPFFGAKYPDARCIDGYLWDMDSCGDDPNVFTVGGDTPCPFCNQDEFLAADPFGTEEECLVLMDWAEPSAEQIEIARKYAYKEYTEYIKQLKERYGKQRH